MPQLIIGLIIIVFIIALIGAILWFVYLFAITLSMNFLVALDYLFTFVKLWIPHLHPAFSWAIMWFFVGGLLYFAIVESPKLNRPKVKPVLILTSCFIIFLSPVYNIATKDEIKEFQKFWEFLVTENIYGRIIVSAANIRDGPSVDYPSISKLNKGEGFKILSSSLNGWSKIKFRGKVGFIYNKLYEESNDIYTPKYTVGKEPNSGALIRKIKVVPGATHISIEVSKGILYAPEHQYGMYLFDRKTSKKYDAIFASYPYNKAINNRKVIKLIFEEIPKSIGSFDLLQGNCSDCSLIFKNIRLQ